MYTREILAPRTSPIEDGNPIIGTWSKAFEKVDLLEIRKPYQFPLPRWARNNRIKEWQYFSAQDEHYMLEAFFCNLKLYRIAQVMVYDKKNGEKFIFRKWMPGTGWNLPNSLANSSVDSHSARFYFRIHTWLDIDAIMLDINIEATRRRPSLTIHLAYNVHDVSPLVASLRIFEQRTMYTYKALTPVRGDIVLGGRRIILKQEDCSGFFCDYKGFFPYRMQTTICSATGFEAKNRR
ncbi:MAG: DUF2804 domain-containing protein, partial [Treponema sp.]|nr:DUF2804 domain-containing protein [Treponema sp.]